MRILADTNVIIDALTSREPWNKSVCMQDVLTVQKMKVCTLEWEYDIANTGYKSY